MSIDTARATALQLPELTVDVERGRLALFARATGQTDPAYTEVAAARAAGHPDLPVPPTFFFSLEFEQPDPFDYLVDLGVDMRHVLHGEQGFAYHAMAYAGDTLTVRRRITDVTSKKSGAMELLTKQSEIARGNEAIATATAVIVVHHPGGTR